MSKSRWLKIALTSALVAPWTIANAQTSTTPKEQAQDFMHDVLGALFSPNWNLFAHGGWATSDRFLLEQAANPADGQRSLESKNGYNVGLGAGVDILLRLGFRASYTFTSSQLKYRTDNGDGSDLLDIDDVGTLMAHTASLEVMRYMLPSRSAFTPYGTVGIQGTWWALDEKSPMVSSSGASTQFSLSPLFAFGVQFKATEKWSGRLEASLAGGHNPFTGKNSFRGLAGPNIDEPTSVGRTDFRFAAVYHFSRQKSVTEMIPVAHR
jgi:opacity protein-like surface antigen